MENIKGNPMSEESQILVAFGSGIQTVAPQADIAYAAATSVIVYNGQTSTGLTATANKSIEVYGVVNSTTVASGGMLNVWAGGSAYSTLVNNGRFFVYNNGKAVSTNQTGGQIHLDGGFMDAAKNDGGVVYVSAGGSARYVDVNSGGMVIVSSGGAVSSSYVNAGGHLSANRGARVVSTLVKSGGYLYANDGANVTFTTVRNGGNLHVRTGGSVTNATINSGGNLYVMGGTAYVHGIVAEQGARLSMGIGAKTDIQGTSAGSAFSYGSVVRGVDVHSNLTLTLRENGSAVAVTVTSGGQLNATSGGTAVSTTVNSRGVLNLDDYGVAVSTTVNSNGHIYATDGGTAISTINRGGYINVSEGGSAVSTTLESNSWLDLFNGGSAVVTTINGGHLMVSSGGTALDTTFNAGWMKVSNGGAAVSTTLANDVWIDVCDGGTAISTIVNSGHLAVSNNGTVSGTIVNSAGQLVVSNGGTARDTVVHSGGMFFAGGGILQGDVVLGGAMTLSSTANAANAAITFDVSERTTADRVIVNDISLLNASNYFITVSASQSNGHYNLAGNATAFNKNITLSVKNTSQTARLTRGVTQTIGNKSYTLDVVNGNLCLAVEQKPVLTIRVDNKNMVYGDAAPSLSYSFTGPLSNGHTLSVSLNLNIANASITDSGHIMAGTYADAITAVATVRDAGGNIVTGKYVVNYDFGDLVVGKRDLYVTIDTQTMTYGDVLPDVEDLQYSYDAARLAAGDDFATTLKYNPEVIGNQAYFSGGGHLRSGVYAHAIVEDRVASDIAANYRINWNYGSLRVDPRQVTVGYLANDKMYDGTTNATRQGGFMTDGILDGDAVRIFDSNVTYSFSDKNAGEDKTVTASGDITCIGADKANYSFVFDRTAVADITPRPAVIGFTADDKTYDGTDGAARDELVMGEILAGDDVAFDDSAIEYRFDDGTVGTGKTVTANGFDASTMLSGNDLQNYSIIFDNTAVADIFAIPSLDNLVGDESGLSWSLSMPMPGYVVEYSQDDFTTAITIETVTTGLSHYNMEGGTWQWRARPAISSEWTAGKDFTITTNSTDPTIFAATTDDVKEAFFVTTYDVWSNSYQAQHVGVGAWGGTNETAELDGKNQITDVFAGSDDASILLMTDDDNGDALFIDDIYSAFPEGLDAQARIAKIDEIRAGDGNDIVDLTSQRFDYIGGGMTVRGGLGDDVIWANNGDNALFGDAGDDRIVGAGGNDVIVGGSGDDSLHGGGGEDIFAFGGDWGHDSVEQLADGKVTLWFEEGSLDKWDAASLTYRDGDKSVAVSGVAAEKISLKFGDDGSEQYGKLLESGAFDEFSSERIFENKNTRGMLA